jgi:hypothetical protein
MRLTIPNRSGDLKQVFTHAAESYEHGIRLMLNDGRVDMARQCALDAWTAREAAKSPDPLRKHEELFALRESELRGSAFGHCGDAEQLLFDARRLLVHVIEAAPSVERLENGVRPQLALDCLDEALDALEVDDPRKGLEAGPKKPFLHLVK